LNIEDFAPNFSFFFSNGMEPEYAVLGQVARRIWAVAMRDVYGVGERCQKLKYHIQTSGRSLHAQHSAFNDIRTTLEAFYATCDNCNSLHTNAYDEAISTPTAASVRQALAIQMILNQEYGLCQNDNPLQGSYLIRELSQGVEREVLREFKALNERGGVLGAMDYHYQRNKIQEEAMAYESAKAHGEIKIIGVNTFTGEEPAEAESPRVRSSWRMKKAQVKQVRRVWRRWAKQAKAALAGLGAAKQRGEFLFPAIMEASKYCTLGQISGQLMELGGRYRRSM
jgi:methylmalonyl-CoA mutase